MHNMNDNYPFYNSSQRRPKIGIPPVVIVVFMALGIIGMFVIPTLLADKYLYQQPQDSPHAFLYADPTRDIANTQNAVESAGDVNRDWRTPVPDGYFKTPENVQAALSGTPAPKLTDEEPQNQLQQIKSTPTPNPTFTITPIPTITPTPTEPPTATMDPLYSTSTAQVEQAKVELAIEALKKEQESKDRLYRTLSIIIKILASIFAIALIIIVGVRIFKEYKLYKLALQKQERIAKIKSNPWLVYPEAIQYEAECVYKLILASIDYYKKAAKNPTETHIIPRFNKLDDWKSNEWVDTTNYLVNRGYIVKHQGKSTMLKIYSLWQMKLIIEQGLYLERNPYEKLVEQSPSEDKS